MSAVVYGAPDSIPLPSLDEWPEGDAAYVEKLRIWCLNNTGSDSDLVGEEISFPEGDGMARYMVFDTHPLTLVWIELGDAWETSAIMMKGLELSDVRDMVARNRKWRDYMEERDLEEEKSASGCN